MTKKKPPTNAAVGAKLKAARKKAGLTQAELGDKIGASYQTISQYETGTAGMSALQLVNAAKALKCSTLDLIP
jgi:transcriptional regulator with XRE-family HTH domain